MKKITYLVNNASSFVSHRLDLAIEAKKKKWNVTVLFGKSNGQNEQIAINKIKDIGVNYHQIFFNKGGLNPLIEFFGLLHLIFLLNRIKPDILHTVTPKGNLYGGIAARILNIKSIIIAISGKGYIFTDTNKSILRTVLSFVYDKIQKITFRHINIFFIVQNRNDFNSLINENGISKEKIILIPGSGVNLKKFIPDKSITKNKLVILPARILQDKGVLDFVEAAKIIKEFNNTIKMVLVGEIDNENPAHIAESKISFWVKKNFIEWWKYKENMVDIYQSASIVCLPSYREGMPKALLEAAACGCPIITTDVIGCREAIIPGLTGDLVQVRSPKALAQSILKLIDDKEKMKKYSHEARILAEKKFNIETVIHNTFKTYEYILSKI